MKFTTGFNVKEAFEATGLNEFTTNTLKNLTQSFRLSGKTNAAEFAEEYLKEKASIGQVYYIVLDKPINDTRNRPYSVAHVKTESKRKYAMSYSIIDSDKKEYDVKTSKIEALNRAKELVKEHKKDMFLKIVKTVIEGEPITASVNYTPSKNTKKGSYLFFELRPNAVVKETETKEPVATLETVTEDQEA